MVKTRTQENTAIETTEQQKNPKSAEGVMNVHGAHKRPALVQETPNTGGQKRPTPIEGRCTYWIAMKNRYCSLQKRRGYDVCGEHLMIKDDGKPRRIPCPYTTKHTMGVWEIKRHTQNCPLKPKEFQVYQVLDINQGLPFVQPLNSRKYLLTMGIEEFTNLHKRIVFLYESVKMTFSTSIKSHPIMNERIKVSNNGKHAVQQSSLVGHLEDKGFIRPDVSFVEFGCGSAEFSKYVSLAAGTRATTILIDKKQIKLKLDYTFKSLPYQRLICDIKDLKLENVDGMLSRSAVAYSKHLCGSATDLTLRCLSNFTKNNGNLMGFVIALCCHQLCTFERYINHKYLNHYGITKHEFDMICVISTWAVCGDSISGNSHWSGLSFELRKQLGYQCKRIIDIGRLRYLQEQGCDCELLYYIDECTSSENMALVCTWNKRSL